MLEYNDKIIHMTGVKRTDYSAMPKADLILVTHHHGDHLDYEALKQLKKENTIIIAPVNAR